MNKFPIVTDYPVPSCVINRLLWKDGKWFYEYLVTNKTDIDVGEAPLYIYGHIQQLTLISNIKKGHLNIKVESMDDLYRLVKKQAEADMEYRKEWIANHPDYYDNVSKLTVKNETQEIEAQHVIDIFEQNEETTTFIVAY